MFQCAEVGFLGTGLPGRSSAIVPVVKQREATRDPTPFSATYPIRQANHKGSVANGHQISRETVEKFLVKEIILPQKSSTRKSSTKSNHKKNKWCPQPSLVVRKIPKMRIASENLNLMAALSWKYEKWFTRQGSLSSGW